ncbi:MAG: pyruvate kinase [Proteobacteria bacterium]|nr:pyruvate kinase [Pseudomonadota bacterium]
MNVGKDLRRTKIVATMGPASNTPAVLSDLVKAGVDVVRLNMSHSDYTGHRQNIATVREVEKELGRPVCILGDLKGPEIRTGLLETKEINLEPEDLLALTPEKCTGSTSRIHISYDDLSSDVSPGQLVYMSDGAISMHVEKIKGKDVFCRVERGGKLGERKGLNFPGANLSLPFLMEKDYRDIEFLIDQNVDFIAASFVRCASDIVGMRKFMDEKGGEGIKIIAKIETQQAVDDIDAIVKISDGIMVARGDLGVEIPIAEVPLVQKMIIAKANRRGIPVITATQMLDSMTFNAYPTRAEVTDVANAIIDGTDAIMLSGETAVGKYPALTVQTMHKLAMKAETTGVLKLEVAERETSISRATSVAACLLASQLGVAAIITITSTGATPCRIARNRPQRPIIACSPDKKVIRQLLLVWGVSPFYLSEQEYTDQIHADSKSIARKAGYLKEGDLVVIVSGIPVGVAGSTNTVKVDKLD